MQIQMSLIVRTLSHDFRAKGVLTYMLISITSRIKLSSPGIGKQTHA